MKKLLIVLSIFFFGICKYSAECSYKDLRELNTFAAYVETSYKYNEETGYFDLTITNLGDKLYVNGKKTDLGELYFPKDGVVSINNLKLGTTYSFQLEAGGSTNCVAEKLRVLTVRIPYKNYYYGSDACRGHENLNVCNSEFLDYQISENVFLSLISQKPDTTKDDNPKEPEKDLTFMERVVEYVSNIYVKIIVVVITSIITISIYQVVLRKIKHGF